jgi:hypothetical protein
MGILNSTPDYITPYLSANTLFESLLDDFYEYNDKDKFCSGLVAMLNTGNGAIEEGILANNERQQELCNIITKYYSIKIDTIKTAQKMIENSKKIIDALERGQICNDFFKDDRYSCPETGVALMVNESVKRSIINVFLDYINKIMQLNDKNQLNRLENIDFTRVVVYKDTILRLTNELLTLLKTYYTQITHNPGIMKLMLLSVPEQERDPAKKLSSIKDVGIKGITNIGIKDVGITASQTLQNAMQSGINNVSGQLQNAMQTGINNVSGQLQNAMQTGKNNVSGQLQNAMQTGKNNVSGQLQNAMQTGKNNVSEKLHGLLSLSR